MVQLLRIYGVRLLLFFMIESRVLYGLGLESADPLFRLLRDGVWWLMVVGATVSVCWRGQWSWVGRFWSLARWAMLCVVGLIVLSVVLAMSHEMSLYERFVGIKYDRYYLLILLSAWWMGSVISLEELVGRRWGQLVFGLLVAGLVWQGLKVIFPDFFVQMMGYGPFGDFMPGDPPPLYYKTGPGGWMRLSGLFVGPNVWGFLLVVLGPLLVGLSTRTRRSHMLSGLWLVWGVSLVATFSRGAYIAGMLGLVASIRWLVPRRVWAQTTKLFVSLLLILATTVLTRGVNHLKSGSNTERTDGNVVAREMLQDNLRGYGPGVAGPARHYRADYSDHQKHSLSLVENIYLQLGVNMGLLGVLLFGLFWLSVLYALWRLGRDHPDHTLWLWAAMIAIVAVSIEGLVLHVWRDSQFNFLFLAGVGLLMGYVTAQSAE